MVHRSQKATHSSFGWAHASRGMYDPWHWLDMLPDDTAKTSSTMHLEAEEGAWECPGVLVFLECL